MRFLLAVAVIFPLLAAQDAPAKGKPLTPEERQLLIGQLQASEALLSKAVAGLTPAQLNFQATPERWSVLQIVEHVAATEDFLFGLATQRVLKMPPSPEITGRTPEAIAAQDQKVLSSIADRTTKAQAPEPAKPAGRYQTIDQAMAAFKEKRSRTVEYARTTQDDLRNHGMAIFPGAPPMDVYEFLLMISAHTERHTKQAEENKTAAGYPR